MQFFTMQILLFIDQGKLVAGTDVQGKVDIPAKQVGQFHGQVVRQSGLLRGQE